MLRNIIKIYIFNKFSKPLNIYAFIETIVKIDKFESTYAIEYNPVSSYCHVILCQKVHFMLL